MNLIERCFAPRLILDLKRRAAPGLFFYLIMTVMVLYGQGYAGRFPEFSHRFLALMVAACAFRGVFIWLDRYMRPGWLNNILFMASILGCALVWGMGCAEVVVQEDEIRTRFLMVVCTVGLCSGGMLAYNPCIVLTLLYNLFLLAPMAVYTLTQTSDYPLGGMVVVASAYLLLAAHGASKAYWAGIENERLLEEKSRELKRMGLRDGLTGLNNRKCFDGKLAFEWKRAVRNSSPLSLLMCDIDHFKQVNDQYGHLAGDAFLQMTARLMENVFRRETDIVARYGGEEFVVLMPDTSLDLARAKAEELRGCLEEASLKYEGQLIRTTLSIGAAGTAMAMGGNAESLLSVADQCLYDAKANGRNQVWTNSEIS